MLEINKIYKKIISVFQRAKYKTLTKNKHLVAEDIILDPDNPDIEFVAADKHIISIRNKNKVI